MSHTGQDVIEKTTFSRHRRREEFTGSQCRRPIGSLSTRGKGLMDNTQSVIWTRIPYLPVMSVTGVSREIEYPLSVLFTTPKNKCYMLLHYVIILGQLVLESLRTLWTRSSLSLSYLRWEQTVTSKTCRLLTSPNGFQYLVQPPSWSWSWVRRPVTRKTTKCEESLEIRVGPQFP